MYLLEKKLIFLVNLTSVVYISSSDCTLIFRPKSEGTLACVALWTVAEAALDKSKRFLYLFDRQWLTAESRFTCWVLMLQDQRCLGSYYGTI